MPQAFKATQIMVSSLTLSGHRQSVAGIAVFQNSVIKTHLLGHSSALPEAPIFCTGTSPFLNCSIFTMALEQWTQLGLLSLSWSHAFLSIPAAATSFHFPCVS